jgi:hypothetical protein
VSSGRASVAGPSWQPFEVSGANPELALGFASDLCISSPRSDNEGSDKRDGIVGVETTEPLAVAAESGVTMGSGEL